MRNTDSDAGSGRTSSLSRTSTCGRHGGNSFLMNGVSTRRYAKVLPQMADTVGVSRSTVSREAIEASEAALKKLMERRFEEVAIAARCSQKIATNLMIVP